METQPYVRLVPNEALSTMGQETGRPANRCEGITVGEKTFACAADRRCHREPELGMWHARRHPMSDVHQPERIPDASRLKRRRQICILSIRIMSNTSTTIRIRRVRALHVPNALPYNGFACIPPRESYVSWRHRTPISWKYIEGHSELSLFRLLGV